LGCLLTYLFAPQVIRGVGWTLLLTVIAMAVAITVAGLLVIMRDSDNPVLRGLAYVVGLVLPRHADLHATPFLGPLCGAVSEP
jgi:ABC-type amino acid transport system permease subunit